MATHEREHLDRALEIFAAVKAASCRLAVRPRHPRARIVRIAGVRESRSPRTGTLEPTELEERPLEAGRGAGGAWRSAASAARTSTCGPRRRVPAGRGDGPRVLRRGDASSGAAVEGFSPGDRVAVYPFASCGECPNCLPWRLPRLPERGRDRARAGREPGRLRRVGRGPPARCWCRSRDDALVRARGAGGAAGGRAARHRHRRGHAGQTAAS